MTRRCQARQVSDSMICRACTLTWDVNDPDPPACNPKEEKPIVSRPLNKSTHPSNNKRPLTREDWKREKAERPITTAMWDKLKDTLSGKTDGKGTR